MNRFPDFYPIENDEFSNRGASAKNGNIGGSSNTNGLSKTNFRDVKDQVSPTSLQVTTDSSSRRTGRNLTGFPQGLENIAALDEGVANNTQDVTTLQENPSNSTTSTRPSTVTEVTTTGPVHSLVDRSEAASATSDTSTIRRRLEKEMPRTKHNEIQSKSKRVGSNSRSSKNGSASEERYRPRNGYGSDESDLIHREHRQRQHSMGHSRHRSELASGHPLNESDEKNEDHPSSNRHSEEVVDARYKSSSRKDPSGHRRHRGSVEAPPSASDEKRTRRKQRGKEEAEHSNHDRRERRSRREKTSSDRRKSISQGAERRRHRSRRHSNDKHEKERRRRRGSVSDGDIRTGKEIEGDEEGSEPDIAGGKPSSHDNVKDDSRQNLKSRRKKGEEGHSYRRRGSSLDRTDYLTSRSKKLLDDANDKGWTSPTKTARRIRSGSVDRARGRGSRSPQPSSAKRVEQSATSRRHRTHGGSAISPVTFSSSAAVGPTKSSKSGGTKLDSKLRAFLEFSKHDAETNGPGTTNITNERISSPMEDDGATLITRAESVQGESKVITGKHRDLLKIAKLTSRSGKKHIGSSGRQRPLRISENDSVGSSREGNRRAKLDLGKKSETNQSTASVTSHTRRRSLAFEIMKWANLVKKGQLSGDLQNIKQSPLAFLQSTILSLRAETVLNAVDDPTKLRDHGTNCFQPFYIESADVMYQYPKLDSKKDETVLGPDVLSAFCFPYGVSVRFFPRAALEGAKKLGWFGESGDKYQLQAFTSMSGATKYGVALVVQEELKFDSEAQRQKIIESLKRRMSRRRAVRRVVIWWRRIMLNRKVKLDEDPSLNYSDSGGLSAAVSRMSTLLYSVSKDSKGVAGSFNVNNSNMSLMSDRRRSFFPAGSFGKPSDATRSQSDTIAPTDQDSFDMTHQTSEVEIGDMDSVRWPTREEQMMLSAGSAVTLEQSQQLQKSLQESMNFENISSPESTAPRMVLGQRRGHRSSAEVIGGSLFLHSHGASRGSDPFQSSQDEVGRSRYCRTRDAYQAMMEHELLGYTIVVETCYVFTNVHPEQQVPLFCAMQQIIEKEREHQYRFEQDGAEFSARDLHLMSFRDDDEDHQKEIDFAFSDHYDVLFDYMHKNLRLSYNESLVRIPKNPYDFIYRSYSDVPKFDFHLPLQYFEKQSLPLPLPNMTAEYGLSRLLLTIRHEALLMVLKLLLLERSVLVVGKTVEEVTCCTCTLLQLLHPFTWASAFMPLIRSDMLEFVSSPVPYLAGMVARDLKQLDSIKRDPCVKEAVREGLSIIDLYRGRLTVTSAEGIWEILVDSHLPSEQMISFQSRLEFLASNEKSTMHSFKKFFKLGLNAREKLTLHAVKQFLGEYLANLANAAVDSSQQLRMFSRIDSETDTFEFEHDEFAELRRKQVLARVSFFDEMCKTQLFLGYVEEKCRKVYVRKDLMKGIEAMVIAHWGVKHWRKLKARQELESEENDI